MIYLAVGRYGDAGVSARKNSGCWRARRRARRPCSLSLSLGRSPACMHNSEKIRRVVRTPSTWTNGPHRCNKLTTKRGTRKARRPFCSFHLRHENPFLWAKRVRNPCHGRDVARLSTSARSADSSRATVSLMLWLFGTCCLAEQLAPANSARPVLFLLLFSPSTLAPRIVKGFPRRFKRNLATRGDLCRALRGRARADALACRANMFASCFRDRR